MLEMSLVSLDAGGICKQTAHRKVTRRSFETYALQMSRVVEIWQMRIRQFELWLERGRKREEKII